MNNAHNTARILDALTAHGGECTRTQLLNRIQSVTDISPYNFILALDTLQAQGKITQREEHGTVYVKRSINDGNPISSHGSRR